MSNQAMAPADVEKYYAMKTHELTAAEYDVLLELGFRFRAHGIFNRNTWCRKVRVHKGYSWSPCNFHDIEPHLNQIRSKHV